MGKYRSDRAYEVEASKSMSTMSCADKCLNKCLGRWCIVGMCIFGIILIALIIIAAIVLGLVIYEVHDDSFSNDCTMINKGNVYIANIDSIDNDCIEHYNISKVFVVGKDVTLISDCKFSITDDEDQLILNKFDQIMQILVGWSNQEINILITDKNDNGGPSIAFAYLLYSGYTYQDANLLIQQIPDVSITYNFMQQIKLYANYIQNSTIISDYEQQLLWSNTSNNITCSDI